MAQNTASEMMGISRPTFTGEYNKAFMKIAMAFVGGMAIKIVGGNVQFEKQWYKCQQCFKLIEGLENHIKCIGCETFTSNDLIIF